MKIKIPEGGLKLPLVPPAVYRLRIGMPKVKVSPESGNTSMNWECTILSESPDPKMKTVGRKAFINTTLTEKSLWNLDAMLVAATGKGFEGGKEYSEEEIIAFAQSQLVNKEIIAKCTHEKRQDSDEMQERWGSFKKV